MEEVQAETVGPLVDLVGTLPHELAETCLQQILSVTHPHDAHRTIATVAQVSKRWYEVAASNRVWSHLYIERYPNSRLAVQVKEPRPQLIPSSSPAATRLAQRHSAPEPRKPLALDTAALSIQTHPKQEAGLQVPLCPAASLSYTDLGMSVGRNPDGYENWRDAYRQKLRMDASWRQRQPWPLAALQEHSAWIAQSSLSLLPSYQRVVSGGADERICVWHTDGYLEWSSPTCAGCACLDAEDQWGVTGAVTGDIEIWNVETGSLDSKLQGPERQSRALSVQWAQPGQLLLYALEDHPVTLADIRAKPSTPTLTFAPRQQVSSASQGFRVVRRGPSRLNDCALITAARLADDTHLLVSDRLGVLHVFDTRKPSERLTWVQAYDPSGREGAAPLIMSLAAARGRAATGSVGGMVKVWDVGALARTPAGRSLACVAARDPYDIAALSAMCADSGCVSGVGGGGQLGTWAQQAAMADLQVVGPKDECALLGVGVGHTRAVVSLSWSEEMHLASASLDSTAAVWDTTGLRLERGCAPVALHHPMAWVPSRDEPLPVSHDHDVPVEGADTTAIILRPNWPDGMTGTGYRQMLARTRDPRDAGVPLYAIDIAAEPGPGAPVQLVVGGADSMVRLYTV